MGQLIPNPSIARLQNSPGQKLGLRRTFANDKIKSARDSSHGHKILSKPTTNRSVSKVCQNHNSNQYRKQVHSNLIEVEEYNQQVDYQANTSDCYCKKPSPWLHLPKTITSDYLEQAYEDRTKLEAADHRQCSSNKDEVNGYPCKQTKDTNYDVQYC